MSNLLNGVDRLDSAAASSGLGAHAELTESMSGVKITVNC